MTKHLQSQPFVVLVRSKGVMLQLSGVDIDIILLEKSKCFVNEQGSSSFCGKHLLRCELFLSEVKTSEVLHCVVKLNGGQKMACFNYFKREIAVLTSILIAFGIEFALGSYCTGADNSCVTKMFVNLLNCSFYVFCIA